MTAPEITTASVAADVAAARARGDHAAARDLDRFGSLAAIMSRKPPVPAFRPGQHVDTPEGRGFVLNREGVSHFGPERTPTHYPVRLFSDPVAAPMPFSEKWPRHSDPAPRMYSQDELRAVAPARTGSDDADLARWMRAHSDVARVGIVPARRLERDRAALPKHSRTKMPAERFAALMAEHGAAQISQ